MMLRLPHSWQWFQWIGLVVVAGVVIWGLQVKTTPTPSTVTAMLAPPQVNPDRLMRHVQALSFERYHPQQRQRAREYIQQELQASGWSVKLLPFGNGVNILAEQQGQSPKGSSLLVAAHYDTVASSPGADDNATGVAAVLEIGRLFSSFSPSRNLKLAFFDLEERGFLGSFAFADNPQLRADLAGVIVLEMLGFACHTPGCQRVPQELPLMPPSDRGDFLVVVGDTEHLPLLEGFQQASKTNLPAVMTIPTPFKGVMTPDLLRSDHAPFWYQNIGAVMVTDTANFRNPHYHQPSDTLETLDREFFAGATQIVVNRTATLLQQNTSLVTPSPS